MTFEKRAAPYVELYSGGAVPTDFQILGLHDVAEWSVTVSCWDLPWWSRWAAASLSWVLSSVLAWRKQFTLGVSMVLGENVSLVRWGSFALFRSDPTLALVYYDYDQSIVDYVRLTSDPDVMVGCFYFSGRLRAWFMLRRRRS